jgi:hypothetical protein
MMTAPFLTALISRTAAKQRLAASSVAPVASGYEGFLRRCDPRFSRSGDAICSGGDR